MTSGTDTEITLSPRSHKKNPQKTFVAVRTVKNGGGQHRLQPGNHGDTVAQPGPSDWSGCPTFTGAQHGCYGYRLIRSPCPISTPFPDGWTGYRAMHANGPADTGRETLRETLRLLTPSAQLVLGSPAQ